MKEATNDKKDLFLVLHIQYQSEEWFHRFHRREYVDWSDRILHRKYLIDDQEVPSLVSV
jgi:hypothetical protein